MGEKGSKRTAAAETTARELTAELAHLGDVTSKKMFGGVGIFESGTMFGIVDSTGAIFLRGGDLNRETFEASGSERHGKMPYWSVPPQVRSDADVFAAWGAAAVNASRQAKKS
ncbi:MAG: TfoX/Sxy family protein [Gemmatimonadetes bacterium]|nr:TfoX/Sxy family protein [Gemmatimonadota bacterium]NNF14273.1 TfoX/Sxy family protein [Gemmatimonadota bacterium]